MLIRHRSTFVSPVRVARIAGILAIVGLVGCSDGGVDPLFPDTRAFTGTWNGDAWSGSGYAIIRNDSLFLVGRRQSNTSYYDEYVTVTTLFTGIGVYAIHGNEGRLSSIVGGDAGYFPSAAGTLAITRDAGDPRTLEGTLSLTSVDKNLPYKFSDGRFRVRVYSDFDQVPPAPCRPAVRCGGG